MIYPSVMYQNNRGGTASNVISSPTVFNRTVGDFFILSFCLSLLLFFFFFFVIFLVLVIQSDLERIFKSCETISHCKHVIIVKDYGKLGILCAENFGGFILRKKKDPPSQKGNAGLLFVMHMMC